MRSVELSIKEILVYILYRWVSVLLIVCLFAALFGGYAFIQQPRGEALQQALAEHELKLAAAKEQASIEIANLTAKRQSYEQGLSILDSEKESDRAVTTLSAIMVYDPINVDPYRLSDKYVSYFKGISLVDVFTDIDSKLLDESILRSLVSVQVSVVEMAPKQIDIRVLSVKNFNSETNAQRLFNYFVENNISLASAGGHILNIKSIDTLRGDDAKSLYSAAKSAQEKAVSSINDQISSINSGVRDIQRQKPGFGLAIVEPMGFGAGLGFIISIIYLALVYVYHVYIILPEQIQNRLNIQYLGGIRRIKCPGFGNIIAGRYLLSSTIEEASKYIVANISTLLEPQKSILITGSLPIGELSRLSNDLLKIDQMDSFKVFVSGDVTKNAETINILPDIDCVILVERLKASTMVQVNRQLYRYGISGIKVVGYILY